MNTFLSSFVLLGLLFPGISFAATQQMIGEYDDWVAYYHKDAGGIVCYMASAPKRDEGKYTKRGDIYAVVTHRPGEKSFDVVNFVAGYTFKPGSKVTVKIGKTTISRLFTSEDKAWAVSDKVDKELVNAMKIINTNGIIVKTIIPINGKNKNVLCIFLLNNCFTSSKKVGISLYSLFKTYT